jgi:outer membrane protein TolC
MKRAVWTMVAVAGLAWGSPAIAQEGRSLSLDEALRLGEQHSEQVRIAEAGVRRARGGEVVARSAWLPQLTSSLSYSRTLASQFSALAGGGGPTPPPPVCPSFGGGVPLAERVDSIAQYLQNGCTPAGGGLGDFDFSKAGFGSENSYNLGLNFSQPVYSGGRIQAQSRMARSGRSVAETQLASARAQTSLDVTQAYYDAQLADRMVEIAEATLAQAEATLQQAQAQQRVGAGAEFDVLRAQVARDNERPAVIQARSNRELAYLRLKQLLEIPLDQPLALTTRLGEGTAPEPVAVDTSMERAPVRQALEAVDVQQAQVTVTRSQMLPSVAISSQYGRVAFGDMTPAWSDFRTNWSVGVAVQLPLFLGGRLRGQVMQSEADLQESRAQLTQTRELAALDTRSALSQLDAARATLEASSGTVEQAEKAYQIAELRYREGISTQIELSDSRLLLEQARVNRAQAERNYEVARMRVQLLPDLPLSTAGAASAAAGGAGAGAGVSGAAGAVGAPVGTGTTTTGAGAGTTGAPGGAAGGGIPGVPGAGGGAGIGQ